MSLILSMGKNWLGLNEDYNIIFRMSGHSKVNILRCMCAKSLESCPTLCNSMDYSSPGFSVHGIFQARILERVAISFSREVLLLIHGLKEQRLFWSV